MSLTLRPAALTDARLLWLWRTEPQARESAFNFAPIDWDTHERWLRGRLDSADCRIWICEMDGVPVGQVRYERQERGAVVDVSIDAAHRGKGLGSRLLTLSASQACEALQVRHTIALVKASNAASLKAFERSGYRPAGEGIEAGHRYFKLERPCARPEAS